MLRLLLLFLLRFPLLSIEFFIVFLNFFSYLLRLFLNFSWMNPFLLEVTVFYGHIVSEGILIGEYSGFHLCSTSLEVATPIELLLFFKMKSFYHIHSSLVDVITGEQRTRSKPHKSSYCIVENVLPVKC